MRIGVFDSGLGGLTILEAICLRLPEYDYIYYGDTANLPYGDKTEEEIHALTKAAILELFERGAMLIIIACNTASVESLRRLQETILEGRYVDRHILGVIIPTVETLIDDGHTRALLIGTRRTIESGKYDRELEKRNARNIMIASIATPALVLLIESHNISGAYASLHESIGSLVGEISTLILGCTHYAVLKEGLREQFPGLQILSQDEIIPAKLESYLHMHPEIESKLTRSNSCEKIITGKMKKVS